MRTCLQMQRVLALRALLHYKRAAYAIVIAGLRPQTRPGIRSCCCFLDPGSCLVLAGTILPGRGRYRSFWTVSPADMLK